MVGRQFGLVCVGLFVATTACSGKRAVHSSDADANGGASGSTSGEGAGGGAGSDEPYGLSVYASTVGVMAEYADVVASRRAVEGGTEVSVVATIVGEDGTEGHTALYVGPNPGVGRFACVNDDVYLSSRQVCCPYEYDSRLTAGGPDCSVTITEIGDNPGSDIAGTFDGWTHDVNGGRLRLQNGRFRARFDD